MNQRFQKLAQEAGLYVDVNGRPWPRNMNGEDIEGAYQKFAQLVVGECIEIVEPTSHHKAFAQGYMGGVDGLDLLYGKVKQIREHFGVEE